MLPLCDTKADASLRKLLPFRKLVLMDRLSSLQSKSLEHEGERGGVTNSINHTLVCSPQAQDGGFVPGCSL